MARPRPLTRSVSSASPSSAAPSSSSTHLPPFSSSSSSSFPYCYSRRRPLLVARDRPPHSFPSSSSSSSSSEVEDEDEDGDGRQLTDAEEEIADADDDLQRAINEGDFGEGHEERECPDHRLSPRERDLHHADRLSTKQGASDQKGKAPLTIRLKKFCKVCKGTDHQAGFRGATYVDCPKKPCFLCKLPGHTTMSCPHRVAMEHGIAPGPRRNNHTSLDYLFKRQLRANVPKIKTPFVIPNQVDRGLIGLHSRRVTCLEFHPTRTGLLLSGDKKGQLGIWNYEKLHEKTLYGSIHSCILNNIKFNPVKEETIFTTSSDGTVSCTDLETGIPISLMNLNPEGWNGPANWRMLYGLDINPDKGLTLLGDNFGYLYLVDARSKKILGEPVLIHKKGSKVVGLQSNPVLPDLLLSCGNDHFARLWDLRHLENGFSLCNLPHNRVVNSAYFSPLTGSKILSTSQDNRIRVWDSILGDLEYPTREIVHSHDFNRHLTPFRAEWDPKDPSESLAVIGRYISENYSGVALHPIDFIDTSTGQLISEVVEPKITTISPVNKLHPKEDILASGSSRSIFIWKPKEDSESALESQEEKYKKFIIGMSKNKRFGGNFDDDSDGDSGSTPHHYKSKTVKLSKKLT